MGFKRPTFHRPIPIVCSHRASLGPLSMTWSFLLFLWLGTDQGCPWAGSHTLKLTPTPACRKPCSLHPLSCLKSLLSHQWWVGFQALPWKLEFENLPRRQEKRRGALASCQSFAWSIIKASVGSGEMNQPRQRCSRSGLATTGVLGIETLPIQGHRSWFPSKCIAQWGSPDCRVNITGK